MISQFCILFRRVAEVSGKHLQLLKCLVGDNHFSMFLQVCFTGRRAGLSCAIFRKNIAYFIENLRCTSGLMEYQEIFFFIVFIEGILTIVAAIQSSGSFNDSVQIQESEDSGKIRLIFLNDFLFRRLIGSFFLFLPPVFIK